mgnify:FL=1
MKKLLLILSLTVITVNVIANENNMLFKSIRNDMLINKSIKQIEGVKKVILGEGKNLILFTVKKDIKNIDINIFDESGKRIIDESMRDGLSMLERGGVSEITLESFEQDGKLYLEFQNIQREEEITLEILLEGEDIDNIDHVIDIEYMEWHRKLCLF